MRRKPLKQALTAALAFAGIALGSAATAQETVQDDRALMIVTSAAPQTQGMAMILASALQQQGVVLNILLCDAAGDLALTDYASAAPIHTPPSNPAGQVTPEGILQQLMANGAQVDVCAIYLPNSAHAAAALREGVGVAAPGPVAAMMRDPAVAVFSF